MNNTVFLTNIEYEYILHNLLNNKSFNTIELFKLKKEPLFNLKELLVFNSKIINYIPTDILYKYRDWILLNIADLKDINIFNDDIQKLLFNNYKNVLDYDTIKTIIKNSSNAIGLYKVNSNIFPLNYIFQLPYISEKQAKFLYKKIKSNKMSLNKINKISSRELLLILGEDYFPNYLKNNIDNFTEDAIYNFHTIIDINFLLSYNGFKSRTYLNFLLKSITDKEYLKLFLKNTNISFFYILLFFNKSSTHYYLDNNKNLSIATIIKLHKTKKLSYINWLNVYKSHLNKIDENNILSILNEFNDSELKKDLLLLFLEKSKFSIDNIKYLSKETLLNESIENEISNRYKSIIKI